MLQGGEVGSLFLELVISRSLISLSNRLLSSDTLLGELLKDRGALAINITSCVAWRGVSTIDADLVSLLGRHASLDNRLENRVVEIQLFMGAIPTVHLAASLLEWSKPRPWRPLLGDDARSFWIVHWHVAVNVVDHLGLYHVLLDLLGVELVERDGLNLVSRSIRGANRGIKWLGRDPAFFYFVALSLKKLYFLLWVTLGVWVLAWWVLILDDLPNEMSAFLALLLVDLHGDVLKHGAAEDASLSFLNMLRELTTI